MATEPVKPTEAEAEYPHGLKLAVIMLPIFLTLFLVSLDRIIIATAIPRITDEFKSFGMSGSSGFWSYGSDG